MGESVDETPCDGGKQLTVTSHSSVRGGCIERMTLITACGSLYRPVRKELLLSTVYQAEINRAGLVPRPAKTQVCTQQQIAKCVCRGKAVKGSLPHFFWLLVQ